MNPVFPGRFENGEFKLATGERERISLYCRGQKDGEAEMILRPRRKRSRPYHQYFMGIVVGMCAKHFQIPHTGMYIMLMQQFRPLVTEGGDLKFMGISKMNTAEMMALGEEIRHYMLHEHGFFIPLPNEADWEHDDERTSRYS